MFLYDKYSNIWMVFVARYISTTRGSRLLLYQGNTYFVNSRKNHDKSRLLWYCSSRKSRCCPASILTFNDRVLGQPPVHTHPPKMSSTHKTKEEELDYYHDWVGWQKRSLDFINKKEWVNDRLQLVWSWFWLRLKKYLCVIPHSIF